MEHGTAEISAKRTLKRSLILLIGNVIRFYLISFFGLGINIVSTTAKRMRSAPLKNWLEATEEPEEARQNLSYYILPHGNCLTKRLSVLKASTKY